VYDTGQKRWGRKDWRVEMTVTDQITLDCMMAAWERDREPPFALVDLLLDGGNETAAEVVRRVLVAPKRLNMVGKPATLPFPYGGYYGYQWCFRPEMRNQSDYTHEYFKAYSEWLVGTEQLDSARTFPTVREALLWLLTQPPEVIPQ